MTGCMHSASAMLLIMHYITHIVYICSREEHKEIRDCLYNLMCCLGWLVESEVVAFLSNACSSSAR